jgi:hypothetical protein
LPPRHSPPVTVMAATATVIVTVIVTAIVFVFVAVAVTAAVVGSIGCIVCGTRVVGGGGGVDVVHVAVVDVTVVCAAGFEIEAEVVAAVVAAVVVGVGVGGGHYSEWQAPDLMGH